MSSSLNLHYDVSHTSLNPIIIIIIIIVSYDNNFSIQYLLNLFLIEILHYIMSAI